MGRFVLSALLLGLVGGASAQDFYLGTRVDYPAKPNEGCIPGQIRAVDCPIRMECFADKQFPNGGRCDCNPLWFKYAGKLPFDDSEWDDGFTTSDCESHHVSRFIAGMFYLSMTVVIAAFIYTDVIVIMELKRVKALRWNATTYSLFYMLWAAIGAFFYCLVYLTNVWDGDKREFWYYSRQIVTTYFLMPANAIIDFEICVTWIDLYDRTSKMSKSTSRTIKALRIFLRLVGVIMSIVFGLWMLLSNSTISMLAGGFMPIFTGGIANVIGGHLITKTLCPDKKDVANPNWKVAEAIRRAVKHATGAKCMDLLGLVGLIATARHPQLGYTYFLWTVVWMLGFIVGKFGWLQYIVYGSRKHLKRFASDSSSAYFGFSTIGLNKTLTTASSKMSSVVSTRSSAAPVEKD